MKPCVLLDVPQADSCCLDLIVFRGKKCCYVRLRVKPVVAGILGVMPADPTTRCFDKYANAITLPPVAAEWIETAATVPQEAVEVGNEMMFAFVPVVGFTPDGAGKFVVLLVYDARAYAVPEVETSLKVGVVESQKGDVVDATSCQVTDPSTIVPPGATPDHAGSVEPVVPDVVATKIRFVPVPEVLNVSNAVGIMYEVPEVSDVDADQTFAV